MVSLDWHFFIFLGWTSDAWQNWTQCKNKWRNNSWRSNQQCLPDSVMHKAVLWKEERLSIPCLQGSLSREAPSLTWLGQILLVLAVMAPTKLVLSVRKNAAHKKAHEKSLMSIEQSLMAGPNCQAGRGKMAQQRICARRGFYRRGRLRKLAHVQESLVGVGLT
jgi:hypothetical protein